MRSKYHIQTLAVAVFLFVMGFSSQDASAQCKNFVKNSCIPQLTPFIHDGNYQSVTMSEGEEAEVYKTVFAGQAYRLIICTENALPNVEFVVSDNKRNVLFDNRKNDNVKIWDFKFDASQQIKLTIRIPKPQKEGKSESGCVGVLFGMKEK